ncbi:hypothetical protein [Streptomyces profundus]|uniref:hypothetical protein n=1 Tax=Streptomyces profundus TaxID=2867410 RepID=UPI001D1658E6|nr:hypothetical protein [Streptomyces sp. MA3_2.13]UED85062.1 hypothetical protein K4G22_13350 [Streptomyces sp. MA3_2.13]
MCQPIEPTSGEKGEDGKENGERPALGPARSARRWRLWEGVSWGTGLGVVFAALDAVAVLTQDEALAVAARALRAVGNPIVDAGQHRRS